MRLQFAAVNPAFGGKTCSERGFIPHQPPIARGFQQCPDFGPVRVEAE